MFNKTITILFLIFLPSLFAQSNIELNGYLQNMQTVWSSKFRTDLVFSNSMSNRFNFKWYLADEVKVSASMRNIFDYGQFVNLIPFYSDFVTIDNGFFDLTEKITSGNSYVLYTNIDRLNFSYTLDKLEIQIGRQRINWGISNVWTPNDIFNSFSFINFDYTEKPGSDAARVQYYFDYATSLEIVSKLDHNDNLTLASKFQFNQWNYDFQILGGLTEEDYIFGAGWSGSIVDAGFTGELTYFKNKDNSIEAKNIFVTSLGSNYMFSNNVFLSFEFLYNSNGKVGKLNSTSNIFNLDYSAKQLSPSRYSLFGSVQYPITPLLSASISSMINPTDGSLFLSPTTEFSLNEDVYLLVTSQFFLGDDLTEWGEYGQFYYLRIKYNF